MPAKAWLVCILTLLGVSETHAQVFIGNPYRGGVGLYFLNNSYNLQRHDSLSIDLRAGSGPTSLFYLSASPFSQRVVQINTGVPTYAVPTYPVAPFVPLVPTPVLAPDPRLLAFQERLQAAQRELQGGAGEERVPPKPKLVEPAPLKPAVPAPVKPVAPAPEKPRPEKLPEFALPMPGKVPQTQLGLEMFALGAYGLAVQHFRQATQERPNEARAYFLLGHAWLALGKYREAHTAITRGLTLDPNALSSAERPLTWYGSQADYAEHLHDLEASLARHPDDSVLVFLYAYQLWCDGRKEEATRWFRRAARLTPEDRLWEPLLRQLPDLAIL